MAKSTGTKTPAPPKPRAARGGKVGKSSSTSKKAAGKKNTAPFEADDGGASAEAAGGRAKGKQLVIVESPAKAKTINKYLGSDFVVMASVGHVRDLPAKNPKGVVSPVPGVDLKNNFEPTYQVLPGKTKTIGELKRAAKSARDIWFATDLDREGEAIAWHLAEELGVDPLKAKRVMFAAITKEEIQRAFSNPHPINMDRVNAQQARRLVDRIVGYQVSPLLWKKVARGLSAGRVQSVAVRLVVEREREIRAFIPEEYWQIGANFALDAATAAKFAPAWAKYLMQTDEKGNTPTQKAQLAWLGEAGAVQAELVEVGGERFELGTQTLDNPTPENIEKRLREVCAIAGMKITSIDVKEDERGKGPAKFRRTVRGSVDPNAKYTVRSVETKRTSVRPAPPYITSTLQQAASTRLGFGARRTMQAAQGLYEGVEVPGEGPVGLITYMRTDSTSISGQALSMARDYIKSKFGEKYLPEKPNFFSSSNKDAQEAHEAIRPTNLDYPPSRVKNALKPDQLKLYTIIWERFVACQMMPAQWDVMTALIEGGTQGKNCVFKASGRTLVFDGFYKVSGVPPAADMATLPTLSEKQPVHPFSIDADQKFTAPPSRFSEASLIKALEGAGIGRPSTYASIIGTIQDRKYVEQIERRLYATDLGEVVTDKLIEGFPKIMDVGYTRDMELELDKVEEDHLDWIDMRA